MDKNYDIITFISKTFTLRRRRVTSFADIIKIATKFTKTNFKDSKSLQELETIY